MDGESWRTSTEQSERGRGREAERSEEVGKIWTGCRCFCAVGPADGDGGEAYVTLASTAAAWPNRSI